MAGTVLVIGIGGVTNGGKSTLCDWLSEHVSHCGMTAHIIHMDDYFYPDDDPHHITIDEYNHEVINWDRPQAVDFNRLIADLNCLIKEYVTVPDQLVRELKTSPDALIKEPKISADDNDNVIYQEPDKHPSLSVGHEENEIDFVLPTSSASAELEIGRNNIEEATRCNLCDEVKAEGITLTGNDKVCLIFIDGIMIYDSKELVKLFSQRYFFYLNFEEARRRRCCRHYPRGEPPSYFEHYAWPRYIESLTRLGLDWINQDSSEFCSSVESTGYSDKLRDDMLCDDTVHKGISHVGKSYSGIPHVSNSYSGIPHMGNSCLGIPHKDICKTIGNSNLVLNNKNNSGIILLNGHEPLTRNCIKVLSDISVMLANRKL